MFDIPRKWWLLLAGVVIMIALTGYAILAPSQVRISVVCGEPDQLIGAYVITQSQFGFERIVHVREMTPMQWERYCD